MDQFYFEIGYLDDKYFVGEYYAEASISSNASIACTISHIRGADLVAFNTASLTADVTITRDVTATLTTQATIDQFIGHLYALRSASMSSQFAQTTSAERTRDDSATLASEFAFLGLPDIITPTGEIKEFAASITATFTQSQTVELYKDMASDLYVDSVCDPDGVQRTRGFDSTQSVEFTQTTVNYRIVQGECAFDALFAPSMTVEAIRNAFAVLDCTAALTGVVNANRSAQIALSSIVNQSLQGDRFRDYVVSASATSQLTASVTNIKQFASALDASAQQTTEIKKITGFVVQLSGAFSPTLTVTVFKNHVATLSSQFAQTTVAKKTVSALASLSGLFAEVTATTILPSRQFFVSALDITTYNSVHPKLYNGATDSTSDQYGNVYSVGTEYYGYQSGGVYYNINAILTKHNPRGELVWQRKLTSFNADLGQSVVRVVEENDIVYVTVSGSYNNSSGTFVFNSYVYKLDLTTDVLQFLPTPQGIIIDAQIYNNNLYTVSDYIAGVTGNPTSEKLVVTKWNSNGTISWSNSHSPTGNSYIGAIYRDYSFTVNSTGVYLGAGTGIYPSFSGWLYKYPLTGGTPTVKSIGIAGNSVQLDSAGNIYVAGIAGPPTTRVLAKFNSSFVTQWVKSGTGIPEEFVINSSDNIVAYSGGTIEVLPNDLSSKQGGTLYTSTSTNTLYSNITADRVRVKNGWLNVSGNWTRTSSDTEYSIWQIEQEVTRSSFQTMVWTDYRDTNNTYLNWNTTSSTPSFSNYSITNASATITNIGASTSGGVSNAGYTTISYTEIPLFVGISAQATLTTAFSLTADNKRFRSTTASLTAQATVSVDPIKKASGVATSTAQATIVANGGYIFGPTANLSSLASISATALRTKQLDAELSTEAVFNVEGNKYPGGGANLVAEVTLTEQTTRIVQFNALLEVAGSELIAINKIGQGLIGLDVTAQQATLAVKTTTTNVNEIVVATQVTEGFKTVRAIIDVEARVTTSTQVDRIKSPDATLTASAVMTVSATVTKTTSAGLTSQITLTIQAVKTTSVDPTLSTVTSLTAQVDRNRLGQVQALAQATQTTTAVKKVSPQLTFQAIASELVVGTKISFDPYTTYRVAPETRTFLVPEEQVKFRVIQETRVNTIQG